MGKQAQIHAMQTQINPHFLYNSLETINWEAIHLLGRSNTISKMLKALSNIFRYFISDQRTIIPFETELSALKNYTEFLEYMGNQNIKVEFVTDPEALNYQVLKLVIQPIVENSIIHGHALLDFQQRGWAVKALSE